MYVYKEVEKGKRVLVEGNGEGESEVALSIRGFSDSEKITEETRTEEMLDSH